MKRIYNFSVFLYNHRVIRYLISGGTAAAVNLALLFVLVHFFGVWYLMAAVVAFIAGICVSFILQKFFTFSDYTRHRINEQTAFHLGLQVFNLGVNTLLMYVGVDLLGIQYLISQILIGSIMAFYNFLVYKYLVFTPNVFSNKSTNTKFIITGRR